MVFLVVRCFEGVLTFEGVTNFFYGYRFTCLLLFCRPNAGSWGKSGRIGASTEFHICWLHHTGKMTLWQNCFRLLSFKNRIMWMNTREECGWYFSCMIEKTALYNNLPLYTCVDQRSVACDKIIQYNHISYYFLPFFLWSLIVCMYMYCSFFFF